MLWIFYWWNVKYLFCALIHCWYIFLESGSAEGRCHGSFQFSPGFSSQVNKTKLIDRLLMLFEKRCKNHSSTHVSDHWSSQLTKVSEVFKVYHLNSLDQFNISEEDAGFIQWPEYSKSVPFQCIVMVKISVLYILAEYGSVAPEPMWLHSR